MVMRRSSCGLGRMEIKSSSEASQFTAFNARSPLPLKPRKRFAAHEELPVTTKRPSEFGLPVLYVPAAAMVSGPLRLLGSATLTSGNSGWPWPGCCLKNQTVSRRSFCPCS